MNRVNFKDVAHLYLGCDLWHISPAVNHSITLTTFRLRDLLDGVLSWELYKPILRPVSDITDEEKSHLYSIVFKKIFKGTITYFDKRTTFSEPRWILMQGVDRLGIEIDGSVWADCDLQPYKYNQHLHTLYLLKLGFDLFGLIETRAAINRSTIISPIDKK